MSKPSFSQLLDGLTINSNDDWSVEITDNWMQGRTTYGGLSAALCLRTVEKSYPDLPPLRSAQVNFIGPVGGPVTIKSQVMRQGRSVAYIEAEMFGEKGLATQAVFCFGANRDSRINQSFTVKPTVPAIESSNEFFDSGFAPSFAPPTCLLLQCCRCSKNSPRSVP